MSSSLPKCSFSCRSAMLQAAYSPRSSPSYRDSERVSFGCVRLTIVKDDRMIAASAKIDRRAGRHPTVPALLGCLTGLQHASTCDFQAPFSQFSMNSMAMHISPNQAVPPDLCVSDRPVILYNRANRRIMRSTVQSTIRRMMKLFLGTAGHRSRRTGPDVRSRPHGHNPLRRGLLSRNTCHYDRLDKIRPDENRRALPSCESANPPGPPGSHGTATFSSRGWSERWIECRRPESA